ncbi:unnamed protein product [Caenorhabditis nigoni]
MDYHRRWEARKGKGEEIQADDKIKENQKSKRVTGSQRQQLHHHTKTDPFNQFGKVWRARRKGGPIKVFRYVLF